MIAVLISGAVRNLEDTWPENKRYFDLLGQPYEVFVHSWSRNFGTPRKVYKDHVKFGYALNFRELRYIDKEIEVSEGYIKSIIPESSVQIQNFNEDEIIPKFGLSAHVNHRLFPNLLNSVAMYQGISRVFSSARGTGSCKYSNFIRLRTDFLLSTEIPLESLKSDLYFGGPGVDPGYGFVSDQFLVVGPEIASKLACCEQQLLDYVMQNGWGLDVTSPFYGERILSKLLSEIRLDKDVMVGPVVGAIKRPVAVPVTGSFSATYLYELFQFNLKVFFKRTYGVCARIIKSFLVRRN
jgi:hypothetical protein